MFKIKFFNTEKLKGMLIGSMLTGILTTSLFSFADMQSIQAFFNGIQIQINGKFVDTGSDKPFLYNGRTYVPTRYVAEGLGATVKWNETSNTVEIDSVVKANYDLKADVKTELDLQNYKVLNLQNGDKYIGEVKDGVANGVGKIYYTDGRQFFGSWENGKRNGFGTTITKDGVKFNGEFKNDIASGKGVLLFSDNEYYMGELTDNIITGHGTFYYKGGASYFGNFLKNKRDGFGVLVNTNNQITSGIWNQDDFVGTNTPTSTPNNSSNINITTNNTPTKSNSAYIEEKKRQYERDLLELQSTLNTAKNEKTAKIFVDGKWEYQADPNVVSSAEKAYQNKLNEFNLWKAANGL